tara:strand:+ start:74 stop:463 length:390 start_codon:yes stop_codon:yes gene_type:complete
MYFAHGHEPSEKVTMRRIRLMVVGPPSFLKPAVLQAFADVGVDLQGPVAAIDLAAALADAKLDGAIIDVDYDAKALFHVVELFDAIDVPALFATSRTGSIRGGFTCSENPEAINAIVHHLLGATETTLQ